jgi:hypothetical protein
MLLYAVSANDLNGVELHNWMYCVEAFLAAYSCTACNTTLYREKDIAMRGTWGVNVAGACRGPNKLVHGL